MMEKGNINRNLNVTNKAQIGEYASQAVFVVPGGNSFVYNKGNLRSGGHKTIEKSGLSVTRNLQFQIIREMPLFEDFKVGDLFQYVVIEKRLKSPRKNQNFMEIANEIQDIWNHVPDEELNTIPTDASEKLDKYLYGNQE